MAVNDDLDIELHEMPKLSGDADRRSFRILVDPEVHDGIECYAGSDTTKELGGILLGRQLEDDGNRYIVVEGYVIALYTDSQRASLTFTHKSWDQMHLEREKNYPGLKIVGWFHTHPGFGIFLSSYDLFIQKSFFDLPWQVAYVVDPLRQTRGFFRWENTEIVQSEYRLLQVPAIEKKVPVVERQPQIIPNSRPSGRLPMVTVALAVALFVVAGIMYWQASRLKVDALLMVEAGKTASAAKQVESVKPTATTMVVDKKADKIIKYKVREGDTLSGICWSLLGDATRISEIANANRIEDPNLLNSGSELVIDLSFAQGK